MKNDGFGLKQARMIGQYPGTEKMNIEINVPTGYTLIIASMDFSPELYLSHKHSPIFISAHHGEVVCNPDTKPCMEAAIALGYNAVTTTLKRSSDGVWFCYHDDNLKNTTIRDSHGNSILENSNYTENTVFSSISWDVIKTWDFGVSKS